jgi:hypothetical protein
MHAVIEYVRANSVRVYATVVAVLALVSHYVPNLPGDLILGIVAALVALAVGEKVQRVENRKTDEAKTDGFHEGLNQG